MILTSTGTDCRLQPTLYQLRLGNLPYRSRVSTQARASDF